MYSIKSPGSKYNTAPSRPTTAQKMWDKVSTFTGLNSAELEDPFTQSAKKISSKFKKIQTNNANSIKAMEELEAGFKAWSLNIDDSFNSQLLNEMSKILNIQRKSLQAMNQRYDDFVRSLILVSDKEKQLAILKTNQTRHSKQLNKINLDYGVKSANSQSQREKLEELVWNHKVLNVQYNRSIKYNLGDVITEYLSSLQSMGGVLEMETRRSYDLIMASYDNEAALGSDEVPVVLNLDNMNESNLGPNQGGPNQRGNQGFQAVFGHNQGGFSQGGPTTNQGDQGQGGFSQGLGVETRPRVLSDNRSDRSKKDKYGFPTRIEPSLDENWVL